MKCMLASRCTAEQSRFSKKDRYIGHVHGRTKGGIGKQQKTVMLNSAWAYVCWTCLPLPLYFVLSILFILFYSSIL